MGKRFGFHYDQKFAHLNGQQVQIMLEELADLYGTTWDTTKMCDSSSTFLHGRT